MLRRTVIKVIALFTLLLPALVTVAPATAQAQPATPHITSVESPNWSGYEVDGSYTEVQGAFTVPYPTTGLTTSGALAVWVGLDGWWDTDLIQAGVTLEGSECNGGGVNEGVSANPGNVFYICPWTVTMQGGGYTEGPTPTLTISAGDTVTVSIWEAGLGSWVVDMKDNTTEAAWSTNVAYNSPGSSAEWIVEDPGMIGQGCGVVVANFLGQCPLPAYSPPVTFTGLGVWPGRNWRPASSWERMLLTAQGGVVARPSHVSVVGAGFSVAYAEGPVNG